MTLLRARAGIRTGMFRASGDSAARVMHCSYGFIYSSEPQSWDGHVDIGGGGAWRAPGISLRPCAPDSGIRLIYCAAGTRDWSRVQSLRPPPTAPPPTMTPQRSAGASRDSVTVGTQGLNQPPQPVSAPIPPLLIPEYSVCLLKCKWL